MGLLKSKTLSKSKEVQVQKLAKLFHRMAHRVQQVTLSKSIVKSPLKSKFLLVNADQQNPMAVNLTDGKDIFGRFSVKTLPSLGKSCRRITSLKMAELEGIEHEWGHFGAIQ